MNDEQTEKKGRLLFISPDYYGFHEVVKEGFKKYSGYEVVMLITNQKYVYENSLERIKNFFSKVFLNRNLKKERQKDFVSYNIAKHSDFDIVFVNRPDMLSERDYALLDKACKRKITFYWDSFEKIKGQKETIKYFDTCYSFDKHDCETYNLQYIHNFYFNEEVTDTITQDVIFLGTFDKRFPVVKKIISDLNNSGAQAEAVILSFNKEIISKFKSENIKFIDTIIPFKDSISYANRARIILDVHHDNQIGLSFRPFEAMGLKKKLITTNAHIKDHDFYDPNNIFIWTDTTDRLPEGFLETPYTEMPAQIKEKYSIKNWVEKILS